jgi:hypothetical protein
MFLRRIERRKNGKTHLYWNIVDNKRLDGGRVSDLTGFARQPLRFLAGEHFQLRLEAAFDELPQLERERSRRPAPQFERFLIRMNRAGIPESGWV